MAFEDSNILMNSLLDPFLDSFLIFNSRPSIFLQLVFLFFNSFDDLIIHDTLTDLFLELDILQVLSISMKFNDLHRLLIAPIELFITKVNLFLSISFNNHFHTVFKCIFSNYFVIAHSQKLIHGFQKGTQIGLFLSVILLF